MSISPYSNYLDDVLKFFEEIGIKYDLDQETMVSFLPGILINRGRLLISPESIIAVGDVLHEAGHLAVLPKEIRKEVVDDVGKSVGEKYTYEPAVILWSVAAAHHLNIPLNEIFHKEGYKGDSDWIIQQCDMGNYIGLPLLQWLGLAYTGEEIQSGLGESFPAMKKWIRV